MAWTRYDREVAEQDWQEQQEWEEEHGPLPHQPQEDLYLDLVHQVEALDRQIETATGLDADVLIFQKNAFAEMLDALAFGYTL